MFQNVRQNEIIFYDKKQNNFLKLNFFHQVSLTKVILGWRFSLNFMVILNARIICILTLGQRRSTVSTQTTIDAQMCLNQYVGTTMAQR